MTYIATLSHIATIARLEAIVVDRRATARTALDHTAVVRTAAQATLQAQVTLVAAAWAVADKLKFECTNFRIRHPLNFVH